MQHQLFQDLSNGINPPEERVFIASWTNYCSKYGMGYMLTDGLVDMHFTVMTVLHPSFKAQYHQNWEISDLGLIKYAFSISISQDNAGYYFGVSLHYYAACS